VAAGQIDGVKVVDSQLATGGIALLIDRVLSRVDQGTPDEDMDSYIDHFLAEKTFFFLPLGHSEVLADQERAVTLAEELAARAPAELRRILEHSAAQARGHRDVIVRFGRHPHRNEVLGRRSTPEELEYLASGKLVHTRPIPQ